MGASHEETHKYSIEFKMIIRK